MNLSQTANYISIISCHSCTLQLQLVAFEAFKDVDIELVEFVVDDDDVEDAAQNEHEFWLHVVGEQH